MSIPPISSSPPPEGAAGPSGKEDVETELGKYLGVFEFFTKSDQVIPEGLKGPLLLLFSQFLNENKEALRELWSSKGGTLEDFESFVDRVNEMAANPEARTLANLLWVQNKISNLV